MSLKDITHLPKWFTSLIVIVVIVVLGVALDQIYRKELLTRILGSTNEELEEKQKEIEKQNKVLRSEISTFTTQVEKQKEVIQAIQANNLKYDNQIKKLKAEYKDKINALKNENESKIQNLKAQIKKQEKEMSVWGKAFDGQDMVYEENIKKANNESVQLNKLVEEIKSELKKEMNEKTKLNDRLQNQIKRLEYEKKTLKVKLKKISHPATESVKKQRGIDPNRKTDELKNTKPPPHDEEEYPVDSKSID